MSSLLFRRRIGLAAAIIGLATGGVLGTGGVGVAQAQTQANPSTNYAGLIARPTSGSFNHVDITWQEPQLTCNGPLRAVTEINYTPTVAVWTGLGGIDPGAQLVQIGTLATCFAGYVAPLLYQPFFRVFPLDKDNTYPRWLPRPVLPGDKLAAQVD